MGSTVTTETTDTTETTETTETTGTERAMSRPGETDEAGRVRGFQPRRGRATPGQRRARERLWPAWGVDIDADAAARTRLDLAELFGGRPVVLEIGFGMGEATARMAAADPGTGILATDLHTPGQGNLLRLIEEMGLTNVRVAGGDAFVLLREMIPPDSLAGVRVFFPDPWPKKRHHKRRLIQPDFVALAASRMAPGAELHCATDWEPYAEQMLEVLTASPLLENAAPGGHGYAPRPADRPLTRFERQGMAKGHVVRDLRFRRVDRDQPGSS
ncbi:tRNA (guanosine(46)-N7)-methyltransferase TrmB [Streptomyces sp. 6N223]|uniref:tRNA (guanosine(46)-N7)-methyltransferase TrmB n=1 Tax=Streptomyces sp. 6N223 TaxID=3457412 RepID=UPI003FD2976A